MMTPCEGALQQLEVCTNESVSSEERESPCHWSGCLFAAVSTANLFSHALIEGEKQYIVKEEGN